MVRAYTISIHSCMLVVDIGKYFKLTKKILDTSVTTSEFDKVCPKT